MLGGLVFIDLHCESNEVVVRVKCTVTEIWFDEVLAFVQQHTKVNKL